MSENHFQEITVIVIDLQKKISGEIVKFKQRNRTGYYKIIFCWIFQKNNGSNRIECMIMLIQGTYSKSVIFKFNQLIQAGAIFQFANIQPIL